MKDKFLTNVNIQDNSIHVIGRINIESEIILGHLEYTLYALIDHQKPKLIKLKDPSSTKGEVKIKILDPRNFQGKKMPWSSKLIIKQYNSICEGKNSYSNFFISLYYNEKLFNQRQMNVAHDKAIPKIAKALRSRCTKTQVFEEIYK